MRKADLLSTVIRVITVIALGAVVGEANATDRWRLAIDCYAWQVKDSGSVHPVQMQVFKGSELVAEGRVSMPDNKCTSELGDGWDFLLGFSELTVVATGQHGYAPATPGSTEMRDHRIRLIATGYDALWFDMMELVQYCYPIPGNVPQTTGCGDNDITYGSDGGVGWCLSTLTSDNFGQDRQNGPCATCLELSGGASTIRDCSADIAPPPVSFDPQLTQVRSETYLTKPLDWFIRKDAKTDNFLASYNAVAGHAGLYEHYRAVGRVFTEQIPGTIPLYHFYARIGDNMVHTHDVHAAHPEYERVGAGLVGYIYQVKPGGFPTLALDQFYSSTRKDNAASTIDLHASHPEYSFNARLGFILPP